MTCQPWIRRISAATPVLVAALAGCSPWTGSAFPTGEQPPGCATATGWVDRVESGIMVIVDGEGEETYCLHQGHLRWAREGVFLRGGLVDVLETRRLEAEMQRAMVELRARSRPGR